MMDITSKYRHRRTTGGGKRWRKRNAHTERHELKSGTDTSMRNVRGASSGGMYPGSFRAGIYARNAAGNGKGAGKMIRCFLILTLAVMIKIAFDIHNHKVDVRTAEAGAETGTDSERRRRMKKKKEAEVLKNRQLLSMAIELAAQSERLVLLNEVGCVEDVIQVAEQLCGKLGNLIAFAKDIQRGAKQHDFEGMHEEKETVHGA